MLLFERRNLALNIFVGNRWQFSVCSKIPKFEMVSLIIDFFKFRICGK